MSHILTLFLLLLFTREPIAKTQTISLELNRVDIGAVLKLLADQAHLNLVLADDVQGNISLHLKGVNWDEALNLTLKTKGLVKQQIGKTLWIAKATEMMTEAKQTSNFRDQLDEFAPLLTRAIPLRYANAKELVTLLKEKSSGILSGRGHILADERTHLIWLSDTPKQINEIQTLIQHLDVPLKQIMIEARVVNVDRLFEKNLGLHFSALNSNEKSFHHKNSLQFTYSNKATETAPHLGMFIAQLGQSRLLDVQLTALANEGKGEFISSPKLITQDQKTALIQAGAEIPYQTKTHSGTPSVNFKKAVLSLEVTPRVLPHKQLLLDLKVIQDSPGATMSNDLPIIDTRQIETHVRVQSGETLVLGGILESNKRHQANEVPFLSKIPLLGYLFQEHNRAGEQRELLVFITPTIVEA